MAESEKTPVLQMRNKRKSYMNVLHATAKGYALMGEGFTQLSEAKGPKEYTRKYVHMQSEVSDVIGYAPSLSYSCDVCSGDPVVDDIVYITDNELVGSDTHREIVTYNEFEGTETARPAYQRKYAVVPDAAADGTEALIYTGTFKAVSDKVKGTWNEKTKAFTAESTVNTNTESSGTNPSDQSNGTE